MLCDSQAGGWLSSEIGVSCMGLTRGASADASGEVDRGMRAVPGKKSSVRADESMLFQSAGARSARRRARQRRERDESMRARQG
eukprot:2354409-Rhodomonas_salina.1